MIYHPQVLERIHQRMISERLQIAQRFRSEGEGEAARISGQKERDINEIESTAYKDLREGRCERPNKKPIFRTGEGLKFPTIGRTSNWRTEKTLKGALYTAVSQKVPGQNSKSEIL